MAFYEKCLKHLYARLLVELSHSNIWHSVRNSDRMAPLVMIDDDVDDKDMIEEACRDLDLPNPIRWFNDCNNAYDYLEQEPEQPFLILCDVNLPGMSGIEFKRKLDRNPFLKKKSIPFVFFSTSADKKKVTEAYTEMTVQGYFQKPSSYAECKTLMTAIIGYWKICKHPNAE